MFAKCDNGGNESENENDYDDGDDNNDVLKTEQRDWKTLMFSRACKHWAI